jgi:signal transduction histidine kinase
MSAHPASSAPGNQKILGELLHSLSQPLTSLRCALEMSVEEDQRQQSVSAALEQTETVIRMVRLMGEYLDSEVRLKDAPVVSLMPVLRSVTEELASIAAVKGVHLQVVGTTEAKMHVEESRLRIALSI